MRVERMDNTSKHSRLITLAASLIVIAALYLAQGVLIPFALALLVAFLLGPLVMRWQRRGMPRPLAVACAILMLLAVTCTVGWVAAGEARDLAAKLPEYRENIRHRTSEVRDLLQKPFAQARQAVEGVNAGLTAPVEAGKPNPPPQAVKVIEPDRGAFEKIFDVFEPILGGVTMAAMVLVFAAVMLLRREDLRDRFIRLVGNGQIFVTTQALDEASQKVSNYLVRQLVLNGVLGIVLAIGLSLIGLPNAVLWGSLFAVLRFIPYLGVWIAAALPVLLSIAISDGWLQPLETIAVIAVVDSIGYMILEPWLYGEGTGISALAILVSTLFWSWLWGPIGLVLATPMTVCLVVMGKYVPQLHFLYLLFSSAPALPPAARLYQRLLAQDQDEAWSIVKAELDSRPLHEIEDSILLPALALVEHDRQRAVIDEDSIAHIHDSIRLLLDEIEDHQALRVTESQRAPGSAASALRVISVPARNATDSVAASMLARALAQEGAHVELVALSEFVGETLKKMAQEPVDVAYISAVPPSRFMHVRYITKRLAKEFPDLEIVVALWTLDLDAPGLAERVPQGPRVHVVTSMHDALSLFHQLSGSARVRREPRSPQVGQAG
jgi:predicted PurR-regulated permease PerM